MVDVTIPKAIMLIYEIKQRCKFKKYFLKEGLNVIEYCGNDVIVSDMEGMNKVMGVIEVNEDLMSIESRNGCVGVLSNMGQKKKIIKLPPNVRYVIEMEKQFYIDNHQCLVQILPLAELYQVKNVENEKRFKLRKEDYVSQNDNLSNKTQQINMDGMFQPTLIMNDYDGSFQPTLVMEEVIEFSNNPPNNTNIHQSKSQKQVPQKNIHLQQITTQKLHFSVIIHQKPSNDHEEDKNTHNHPGIMAQKREQLKTQRLHQNEPQSLPMPDTIQDQMPPTILDQMPNTVQQKCQQKKQQNDQIRSKTVPIKSTYHTQTFIKIKSFQIQQKPIKKNIEDFDDLFDLKESPNNYSKQNQKQQHHFHFTKSTSIFSSSMHNTINHQLQQKNINGIMKEEKQEVTKVEKNNIIKKEEENNIIKKVEENNKIKKVAISNCKLNEIGKEQLRKRSMQLISDPNENYQILIINNDLKRSPRLLIALMQGKQIHNESWLLNSNSKIVGKLQGFPWEQIEKRKGRKGEIFHGKYYICDRIKEQFWDVMVVGGANMVEDVSRKHNQDINIILTKQDKQFYDSKKHYKRWKFYESRMIIESVLIGQEVKQKYLLDQYSF